ncbi:hypothetical protein Tco_0540908 [Tanacetum coccineum]
MTSCAEIGSNTYAVRIQVDADLKRIMDLGCNAQPLPSHSASVFKRNFTYTSISSEARSWSILTEDPYEEAARQALEQASPPLSLAYVPDPMKLEDHPLPDDASPIALSPGYIADFDLEEDTKEDPADYPVNGGDDDDDESSDDDDDDVEEDEEDEEEEEEGEENLASADSIVVASPAIDLVPSIEETEPFKMDKYAATPPPPAYRTTSRIFVRSQAPILFPSEVEVARLLSLPTLPPSPLTPLSSPFFQIPPPPTSPTYAQAPLVVAARQAGQTLAYRVDYRFIDTMDASIRAAKSRVMNIAWSHSESRIQAMEAQIRALQRAVDVLQRQRISDEDRLTAHIQHEHDRFRERIHTVEAGPQEGPADDAGSSY